MHDADIAAGQHGLELSGGPAQSVTDPVISARAECLEHKRGFRERYKHLQEITRETRAGVTGSVSNADQNDLYGEDGLSA